jgi:quercetin dioxygenase-like cupin family protein
LKLTDLVEYQQASVVSRSLLRTDNGSITLYAFDREEGLSEHALPDEAMILVLDGAAELTVDGTAQRVEAGGVLLLPAGRPHAVRAVERFKMMLTRIRS